MLRPRLRGSALAEATGNRPRWLTNGVVNLAVLCALIVLMGMLSPRLGRTGAGITFFVGLAILLIAVAFFVGATRRLAARRHRRQLARRAQRDHDRDAHRLRSHRDVPVVVRRLAAAGAGACPTRAGAPTRRNRSTGSRVDL